MNIYRGLALIGIFFLFASTSSAELVVSLDHLSGKEKGQTAGTVAISETVHGLVFTPNLKGLTPGLHGFHVHQNPNCAAAEKDGKSVSGLAAGGHFDPQQTNHHGTPWGDGHLGDLPVLYVDQEGLATSPVLAPRLKLKDIKGRALMIHSGGDNYSDQPTKLGGGGARMVCGVIE